MPNEQDVVKEAREFVVTSALYKNPNKARRIIETLCDEVDALRKHVKDLNHDLEATIKESEEVYRRMMHDNA